MSSVAKYRDRWRARYRDRRGREHSKHFARKVDADKWLAEQESDMLTGRWVDPQRAKATVATMAATWLDAHPDWSASTKARNKGIVDNYVVPGWGKVKLADVEYEDLQAWVAELTGKLSGGTVRKVAGVMSGILSTAVKAKRLASNPMDTVKLPKQDLAPRKYLSGAQVEDLAHAAGEHFVIVYVLAYCGLRIGELAALKVGAVDQLRRRLRVEQSVTEVNGQAVWSSPKDHQRRSVPYPQFLDKPVSELLDGRGPGELLFTSPRGEVVRVRNMRRQWFDAAARAAGVPGLTPHELRHTAASLAVSAGASVLGLQRMLGHEKASVTLDVYSDLFDEDLDQVAARMTSARAELLRSSGRGDLFAVPS